MERVRRFLRQAPYLWSVLKKIRIMQRKCQCLWAFNVTYRAISSSSEVMLFAKEGKVDEIENLLIGGAEVNARDEHGRTPLHYAIACGRSEAAACLLKYGADHKIMDEQGNFPLNLGFTNVQMLHVVRQRYRRFKKKIFTTPFDRENLVNEWLEGIEDNGIVKISGLIEASELKALQSEFSSFIQNMDEKIAEGSAGYKHYDDEEHWRPELKAYITNNAFKYSKCLIDICCKAQLIEIIRQYYGRDVMVSRGVGMRYLPNEQISGNDQFQWHHDLEDKRLKMMVLLTDIDDEGQSMSYILGSHKAMLPYEMFFNNSYPPEYVENDLGEVKILNTKGKAGDIFLFDSNGSHRGNRCDSAALRDAFFVEFTDDENNIWGGDIANNYFDERPDLEKNLFKQMMSTQKKWEQPSTRKYCDWITDLIHVDRWLTKREL